jgi:hypothetical protein
LTGALGSSSRHVLTFGKLRALLERSSVYTWVNKERLFFLPFSLFMAYNVCFCTNCRAKNMSMF